MSTNAAQEVSCCHCGVTMQPGKALQETLVVGLSDFGDGDMRGQTVSAGGPGEVVDCLKCPSCGYSVTP